MKKNLSFSLLFIIFIFIAGCKAELKTTNEVSKVTFEYAPPEWQTCIGLPDDAQKSLVGKPGQLLYEYQAPYAFYYLNTEIYHSLGNETEWIKQENLTPKIPIVVTSKKYKEITITESAFTIAPPLKKLPEDSLVNLPGRRSGELKGSPRHDIILIQYKNNGEETIISPTVHINSTYPENYDKEKEIVNLNNTLYVLVSENVKNYSSTDTIIKFRDEKKYNATKGILQLKPFTLKKGKEKTICLTVCVGEKSLIESLSTEQATNYKEQAIEYWKNLPFPYNKISVPDTGVQALLNSSIRNIFQAREIKNGLPAYQVGPTQYRGLWVVDGAFLLESMTYLGQIEDTKRGIEYMLSFQNEDGSFELIREHWKETGIVLWAVTQYARLTGDKEWLLSNWTNMEKAFAYIDTMRAKTMINPDAPNAGLIPEGFSDGGLGIKAPEYTNIYWTLAGMNALIDAAGWLNKNEQQKKWKEKYNSFYETFYKAAKRDTKKDKAGNNYVPVLMVDTANTNPARAQWAFCHAVHPGKIFQENDALVNGNMAMLQAEEREGLIYETGWTEEGVWNYFGSFYAHAWLWLRKPQKAIDAMYAMANHASPTLVWREEQTVQDASTFRPCGDMPHNWASAEFIRMIKNFLAFERGNELHLFEALPKEWTAAGMVTELNDVYTELGILSLKFEVNRKGTVANVSINLKNKGHREIESLVLHTETWNPNVENISLAPEFPVKQTISIK
jgi:hypothetical protein